MELLDPEERGTNPNTSKDKLSYFKEGYALKKDRDTIGLLSPHSPRVPMVNMFMKKVTETRSGGTISPRKKKRSNSLFTLDKKSNRKRTISSLTRSDRTDTTEESTDYSFTDLSDYERFVILIEIYYNLYIQTIMINYFN